MRLFEILKTKKKLFEFKGWMGSNGEIYEVPQYEEHCDCLPPQVMGGEYTRFSNGGSLIQLLRAGLEKGYCRFGTWTDEFFIHFDKDSPGGIASAIHALDICDDSKKIIITTKPWNNRVFEQENEKEFQNKILAKKYLLRLQKNKNKKSEIK